MFVAHTRSPSHTSKQHHNHINHARQQPCLFIFTETPQRDHPEHDDWSDHSIASQQLCCRHLNIKRSPVAMHPSHFPLHQTELPTKRAHNTTKTHQAPDLPTSTTANQVDHRPNLHAQHRPRHRPRRPAKPQPQPQPRPPILPPRALARALTLTLALVSEATPRPPAPATTPPPRAPTQPRTADPAGSHAAARQARSTIPCDRCRVTSDYVQYVDR